MEPPTNGEGRRDIEEFVARFSEEPGFFDFARFGPIGDGVQGEISAHTHLLTQARFGSLEPLDAHDARLREVAGRVLGVASEQTAFQPSTTQGLLHAFFGISGTVAIPAQEHPALTYAAQHVADALGRITVRWIEPDHERVTPGNLREELDDSVSAVAVSLVDARTGYLIDLEGVRQVIGDRLLILDAAQGLGVVDAPFELADVVASTGGKWLRAGGGTGILSLSERALDRIKPMWAGARLADIAAPEFPPPPPERGTASAFSAGQADPAAQARLAAAMEEIDAVGVPAINARLADRVSRVIDLMDEYALPVVSPRAEHERAGIVVVEPDPAQLTVLAAALHNHGITATIRAGRVRFAPHATTSEDSLGQLRSALLSYATASPL